MKIFRAIFALAAVLLLGDTAFGVTVDTGIGGVEGGLQTRRPGQWSNTITELDPREAPFLHLFLKLERTKTVDPAFQQFEDEDLPGWTTFAADYLSSDTTLTVADGSIIGDSYRIWFSKENEIIKVGTVSGVTLSTCTRAYNGTTAAAITSGDDVLILGEIVLEGRTTYPAMKTTRPVQVENYVELFVEAFGTTGTMDATKMRGPSENDRRMFRATRTFRRKIERALRVGTKSLSGSAPNNERHTGGFESFVETNWFDLDGAISEPDLMYIAERVFRHGSEDKLVLCGRNARLQIDMLGMDSEVISAKDSSNPLGMEITKVRTSAGTLNFTTDHFLEHGLADTIHIIDLQNASLAVLRDVELHKDIEVKKADVRVHEWQAEVGLYIGNERSHAVIKGCSDIG